MRVAILLDQKILILFFIGNSKYPCCFKKSAAELGLAYSNSQKACMTSDLFFDWLKLFDLYIGRTPGRNYCSFLTAVVTHGKLENKTDLQKTTVKFLPPNTTSWIQPLDTGIIAALKVKYRRRFMEYAFDQTDKEEYDIYKVGILMAMKWLCDA